MSHEGAVQLRFIGYCAVSNDLLFVPMGGSSTPPSDRGANFDLKAGRI